MKLPHETIDSIKNLANENIDLILSELGVNIDNMNNLGSELRSSCPVHDGDNPTSFCYNIDLKKWACYSKNCHEGNNDIFGLVKVILSKNLKRDISFYESVTWLSNILKFPINNNIIIEPVNIELSKVLKVAKIVQNIKEKEQSNIKEKFKPFPVSMIQGKTTPSWYFLQQGFSKEILTKYNVGYCDDPFKPMYLRSYVPILDDSGKMVIGITGRIVYEKCNFCSYFHEQGKGCPTDTKLVKGYSKWQHYGFSVGSVVYNSWFANPYIKKSNVVIVTEGPKEVWWLEQHGIHNSVCIFGLNILDYHLKKLIQMGTLKVILGLDNDSRGQEASEKIIKVLKPYFQTTDMNKLMQPNEDIDDIPTDRIKKEIIPFIRSLENN